MKKIISVVLSLSLVFSAMLLLTPAVSAEEESWAFQASRSGGANGPGISYSGFNWDGLGENLVPDPTVSHFENGVYGKYATPDAQWKPENINPYYWWDKYLDEYLGFTMYYQDMEDGTRDGNVGGVSYRNGFQSPANRSMTQTTGSLTADGSGVLRMSSAGGTRGVPLPAMEANKYYVIKFNVMCASRMDNAIDFCFGPDGTADLGTESARINMGSGFANGEVSTACFVVYTGTNSFPDPLVKIYCTGSTYVYLDDFGMYEVSEEYAADQSVGVKLTDLQNNTTAYGYRNNYAEGTTCLDSKNLVTDSDCTSSEYWNSSDGFVTISEDCALSGNTSLKVSGSGTFTKLFNFDENTDYYLSLWGRGDGTPVSDINFGFMDVHGQALENPLSAESEPSAAFEAAAKAIITIQCQDGSWYNRVYRFNTGNVSQLYFFITGTKGTLYLDDIRIFKKSDGFKNTVSVSDLTKNSVSKYDCNEQYNIIPNGDLSQGREFWENFLGFGESVNVLSSNNYSVLHFKSNNNHCYYLPYVTVESGINYTYSYWAKNISGSKTKYGIVSLNNPKGFISDAVSISSSIGQWKQHVVSFTAHSETKIAFAIFDVDGEAIFDEFKLFETSDGVTTVPETPTDTVWAFQVSSSSSTGIIDYSDYDWDGLGENLIPDPMVSHFDAGGEYGRYAKFDSGHNPVAINSYYWWDKYNDTEYGFKRYIDDLINGGNMSLDSLTQDQNGYYELAPGYNYGKPSGDLTFHVAMRSPLNWNAVKKNDEYASLTDDGTGVLRFSSSGAWRAMPLPEMEANKYYVVKFNMKSADSNNGSLELCLQFDNGNTNLGSNAAAVTLGTGLTNARTDVICFVVYTGINTYSDPFIKFYCQTETFFDDFGMYEVSEAYALEQSAGVKLTEYIEPEAFQVARGGANGNGVAISYTDFEWSSLGENLIPDPTVSHFESGVYGKYATPDAQWKPTNINPYYWWDKYLDEYLGFTMYYQDMEDGTRDGNVGGVSYRNGFQSPANRSMSQTADSLTADGSGVLRMSSAGGTRGVPLPAMEANKYYVIKFNVKCASQMDNAIDFCFGPDGTADLGTESARINMGSGFANGEINTACFVVYTGTNSFPDPLVKIYCTNSIYVYLDDFGMYEVSEEYALEQSEGVKLTDLQNNT